MFPSGLEKEVLRHLYRQHLRAYGSTLHNLDQTQLHVLAGEELESDIPRIVTVDGNYRTYHTAEAGQELRKAGLAQFSEDSFSFWLTPAGFTEASMGPVGHALAFLNANAGVATVISLISLIVSVIALFASTGSN